MFVGVMSEKVLLGQQITASFEECNTDVFIDSEQLLLLLRQVVDLLGFEEVSHLCHPFTPQGMTCVLVLAQSHLIAHTWPEYRSLVIDLFACGDFRFQPVAEFIQKTVNAKSVSLEKRLREIRVAHLPIST